MSAMGIPSISAAYGSVRKEQLPMATKSLNIVQRLGGPALTTLCASFLGWQRLFIRPPMQPKRLRSALPSYAACMSC